MRRSRIILWLELSQLVICCHRTRTVQPGKRVFPLSADLKIIFCFCFLSIFSIGYLFRLSFLLYYMALRYLYVRRLIKTLLLLEHHDPVNNAGSCRCCYSRGQLVRHLFRPIDRETLCGNNQQVSFNGRQQARCRFDC